MRKTVSASVCSPVGDQAPLARAKTSTLRRLEQSDFSTLELLIKSHKALLKRDLKAGKIVGAYISPEQKKLLETVIHPGNT
jgi:hypothetical protein